MRGGRTVGEGAEGGPTGRYVVIAELAVRPERLGDCVALARAFAAECPAQESGCRQFRGVRLEAPPGQVLSFEAYDLAYRSQRATKGRWRSTPLDAAVLLHDHSA